MAKVSEVKCGKCDRYYSAVRAHCPFCGARRGTQGKHARDIDNLKAKMIIGIVVFALLVVGVGIGLAVNGNAEPTPTPSPSGPLNAGDGVVSVVSEPPNTSMPPEPSDTPLPSEPPPVAGATAIEVQYNNAPLRYDELDAQKKPTGNKELTLPKSTSIKLTLKITPSGIEDVPVWTSSNTAVFDVVATDTTGRSVTVTWIKNGNATLTVTCGGKTQKVIIRCGK
ncbi:MAG: hypothetical protein LBS90_06080 [Oscillospiraceae bacterium]|jgi:hypothetical protein|nr:hypothetical protein [Oscillospiraceae bacterium]